jgi:hypothetical protein
LPRAARLPEGRLMFAVLAPPPPSCPPDGRLTEGCGREDPPKEGVRPAEGRPPPPPMPAPPPPMLARPPPPPPRAPPPRPPRASTSHVVPKSKTNIAIATSSLLLIVTSPGSRIIELVDLAGRSLIPPADARRALPRHWAAALRPPRDWSTAK